MLPGLVSTTRIFSDNTYTVTKTSTDVQRPPLWRVLHWREAGREENSSRPEMWPLFPDQFVNFTRGWQLLSRAMNPMLSDNQWTSVYGSNLWIANQQGFGMANSPRVNFVTGENLGAAYPKCELLTCGGNLLTGTVVGNDLRVSVLDGLGTPPSLEWILARPWYYVVAVQWYTSGAIGRFPQGEQPDGSVVPILHPLIGDPTRFPDIRIPLSCLQKWDRPDLPDPFSFYA